MKLRPRSFAPILVLIILGMIGVVAYLILKPQTPSLYPSPTPTASQAPNGDLANWKTYTNFEANYTIKYPEYYKVEELEIFGTKEKNLRLIFSSVKTRSIRISKHLNKDRESPEEFAKDLYIANTFGQKEPIIGKDLLFENTLVANINALKVSGLWDDFVILVPLKDMIYEFSASGFSDKKGLNEFDQILSTFQFLD